MPDARAAARRVRALAAEWSGRNRRARRRLDGTRAVVLMYHRVLPPARVAREAVEPGMYVTPETFARHLDWLGEHFRVLPLCEIVARVADGRTLPARACAISFDDGWRDNVEHALPALEQRGLPATVFVVSERVGTRGAFWPDEVCARLAALPAAEQRAAVERLGVAAGSDPTQALLAHLKRVAEGERRGLLERLPGPRPHPSAADRVLLDWDEIDRLARAGIDVESHGATHAILTGLPGAEVDRELRRSRERLRERGHGRHALLAYPSGATDPQVVEAARRAGYRAAVTTRPGLLERSSDPLLLPRVGLHDDVTRTRAEFLRIVSGVSP